MIYCTHRIARLIDDSVYTRTTHYLLPGPPSLFPLYPLLLARLGIDIRSNET